MSAAKGWPRCQENSPPQRDDQIHDSSRKFVIGPELPSGPQSRCPAAFANAVVWTWRSEIVICGVAAPDKAEHEVGAARVIKHPAGCSHDKIWPHLAHSGTPCTMCAIKAACSLNIRRGIALDRNARPPDCISRHLSVNEAVEKLDRRRDRGARRNLRAALRHSVQAPSAGRTLFKRHLSRVTA